MDKFPESIGYGGIWIKQGKKSKFLSISGTLAYNGHQITINGIAFKNENKNTNKHPNYNIKWTDARPSETRNVPKPPKPEEDLPF